MRIMLDTNIFISMIFFPSAQTRELARRLTESHQIVVCDYVIEELRLVTERKFPAKRKFLDRFSWNYHLNWSIHRKSWI